MKAYCNLINDVHIKSKMAGKVRYQLHTLLLISAISKASGFCFLSKL